MKKDKKTQMASAMAQILQISDFHLFDDPEKELLGVNTFSALEGVIAHIRAQEFSRSEEHTSELQSRGHLVCRLLLEKKKSTTSYSFPFREYKTTKKLNITKQQVKEQFQRPTTYDKSCRHIPLKYLEEQATS